MPTYEDTEITMLPEKAVPFDFDKYVSNPSSWKVYMRNGEIVKNLKVKHSDKDFLRLVTYVLEGTFIMNDHYISESWTTKGEFYDDKTSDFDLVKMVSISDEHGEKITTSQSTAEVYKLNLAPSNFINVFYYPEENVVKALRTHYSNYNDALLHQESTIKTSTKPCEFLCSIKIEDHPQVRELLLEKGLIEKVKIPKGKTKQ